MPEEFEVTGNNPKALFTMKLHRGDGMTLIAMDWKKRNRRKTLSGLPSNTKSRTAIDSSL